VIEFQQVTKSFQTKKQKVEALKGIDLTVEKGDIFGVVGYSGAGKSTLIRLVNLLERPSTGQVLVDGQPLTELKPKQLRAEKKKIGMIFQHFNLLNSKTVFDNVAIPLVLSGTPKTIIKARVEELLDFVGLSDKEKTIQNNCLEARSSELELPEHLQLTHPFSYVMKQLQHWIHKQQARFCSCLKKSISNTISPFYS